MWWLRGGSTSAGRRFRRRWSSGRSGLAGGGVGEEAGGVGVADLTCGQSMDQGEDRPGTSDEGLLPQAEVGEHAEGVAGVEVLGQERSGCDSEEGGKESADRAFAQVDPVVVVVVHQ